MRQSDKVHNESTCFYFLDLDREGNPADARVITWRGEDGVVRIVSG
jgi:hypothetical protein